MVLKLTLVLKLKLCTTHSRCALHCSTRCSTARVLYADRWCSQRISICHSREGPGCFPTSSEPRLRLLAAIATEMPQELARSMVGRQDCDCESSATRFGSWVHSSRSSESHVESNACKSASSVRTPAALQIIAFMTFGHRLSTIHPAVIDTHKTAPHSFCNFHPRAYIHPHDTVICHRFRHTGHATGKIANRFCERT